jgi:hypothetical protein
MTAVEPIDPLCLAAGLGHGITDVFAGQLLLHPRLARRCSMFLEARLEEIVPTVTQAVALGLDRDGLLELARRAGAVWHAGDIVQLIDGAAIRDLVTAIGAELRILAIRHHALAPPLSKPTSVTALSERIAYVGQRCLVAWCAMQPAPIWYRIALKLGCNDEPPEFSVREQGPRIVDALLASMKETAA